MTLEGFHLDGILGFSMPSVAAGSAVSLLGLFWQVWRDNQLNFDAIC